MDRITSLDLRQPAERLKVGVVAMDGEAGVFIKGWRSGRVLDNLGT